MNVTISQYSHDPLARVVEALYLLIDKIEKSHQTFWDNISVCRELRKNRKEFEQHMKFVLTKFKTLPEKGQVQIELDTFQLINRLNIVAPKAIEEVHEDGIMIFSWFLIREIKLTVKAFEKGQKKMEQALYPDSSKLITGDAELYDKLAQEWGDLANDDY